MKLISALLALVVCAAAASDDHHKLHQQKQLRGIAKSYGDTTDPANLADDVVDKAKAGAIRHLVSSDEEEHLTEPSDGVLSAISKRLLRVAVGAADSLYSRDLRQRSIDSYKISKTMADGLDCIYSGKRVNPKGKSLPAAVPIGKCLTEILGSNKVIKQGGLLQKVMNAAAKPLQARRDHFLAKETANKIAAGIAYIAANVKSHAEFKDEVMLLIQMEVASDEIKLAPEALDGLNLFLIVADLEGDEVSGGAFEDNLN